MSNEFGDIELQSCPISQFFKTLVIDEMKSKNFRISDDIEKNIKQISNENYQKI